MQILALDLGKGKTVACDFEAATGEWEFETVATSPRALHDLIAARAPDRVVLEIGALAGWVCDLVPTRTTRRGGGRASSARRTGTMP